jgi:glutamyl-tRNA reductase
MKFSITGVNHKSAPVEVRERLAFDESALAQALISLKGRPGFCEGMILSTCNRVEVALTCEENANSPVAVDQFLADIFTASKTAMLFDIFFAWLRAWTPW